jgi:multidrug efflux pump
MGAREYAMRIWLDRNAMAARGITVQDVEAALKRENTELPAGRIESSAREFTVRTATRLVTPEQFARIVLRQEGQNLVRLGDVATVAVGPRDDRSENRMDGRPSVMLGVVRQSTANTVEVSQGVRRMLDMLSASLPTGMEMKIRHDESIFISSSIREVISAIGVAVVLVVAVIWGFLRTLRATLIPLAAIPVSLIAAMAVLAALGFSLNVLTLLAFVLAVGLVVDDAIVVVENASRRVEMGEPPLLASFRGARQIGFAVIATTLVLIAVIMPLAGLEGMQGRLFREFAVALAASVGFSALVALSLSPMLCSKLLRHQPRHGALFERSERLFGVVTDAYGRALQRVLARPWLALAGMAAVLVFTAGVFRILPAELAPTEDRGFFRITLQAPEGATRDYTRHEVETVEGLMRPYEERGEIAVVLDGINAGGFANNTVSRAQFNVRLTAWEERTRSAMDIVAELRPKLMAIPGARVAPSLPSGLAQGSVGGANQIQFILGGTSFEELAPWRDEIVDRLGRWGGLVALNADYDETKPQLRIDVDRSRAADLGIGIADIGNTLETMMGGRQVTRYLDRGEEYDVMLQAADRDRANPRDLSNIYIRGANTPQLIPLANLIHVADTAGATELNRYNRQRAITITGNLVEGVSMGEAIDRVREAVREVLPPEARLSFEGPARQQLEASQSILFAFGMALLVAFLVLAAQFENFRLPAIILMAAPTAVAGGVLAIAATGRSINLYTEIGLIMLIGLVSKNAILIVEFANQLRDEGRSLDEAVREACSIRLRPILMTSIATVFGALPLALGSGAGAESRQAIGWVIVGGITVGTALSLFVTPVLYRLFARNIQPIGTIRKSLQRMDAEHRPLDAAAE